MFMALFRPLQAINGTERSTQYIVTMCHIDMFRSELIQTNGKCTTMTFYCLLQLTKITKHGTQIVVTSCH